MDKDNRIYRINGSETLESSTGTLTYTCQYKLGTESTYKDLDAYNRDYTTAQSVSLRITRNSTSLYIPSATTTYSSSIASGVNINKDGSGGIAYNNLS